MIILIPPSERKSLTNNSLITFKSTNSPFSNQIEAILSKLNDLDQDGINKLYGTSFDKSRNIHRANLEILNQNCSPAIDRYEGVVYKNLQPSSLDSTSTKYLFDHVRITSAFMGLISADTLIPYYKLKMGSLNLAQFWNPIFSKSLEQEDLIIDLLPQIHRKSYTLGKATITVDFKTKKEGKTISSGHMGKAIKGKFIRFLIQNQIKNIRDMKEFNEDGFIWDSDTSAFYKTT